MPLYAGSGESVKCHSTLSSKPARGRGREAVAGEAWGRARASVRGGRARSAEEESGATRKATAGSAGGSAVVARRGHPWHRGKGRERLTRPSLARGEVVDALSSSAPCGGGFGNARVDERLHRGGRFANGRTKRPRRRGSLRQRFLRPPLAPGEGSSTVDGGSPCVGGSLVNGSWQFPRRGPPSMRLFRMALRALVVPPSHVPRASPGAGVGSLNGCIAFLFHPGDWRRPFITPFLTPGVHLPTLDEVGGERFRTASALYGAI